MLGLEEEDLLGYEVDGSGSTTYVTEGVFRNWVLRHPSQPGLVFTVDATDVGQVLRLTVSLESDRGEGARPDEHLSAERLRAVKVGELGKVLRLSQAISGVALWENVSAWEEHMATARPDRARGRLSDEDLVRTVLAYQRASLSRGPRPAERAAEEVWLSVGGLRDRLREAARRELYEKPGSGTRTGGSLTDAGQRIANGFARIERKEVES